jgi:hypothetical protein
VIVTPPLEAGAVQVTEADESNATALTSVGASGLPTGVTAVLAVEAGPVPLALVAVTVNV